MKIDKSYLFKYMWQLIKSGEVKSKSEGLKKAWAEAKKAFAEYQAELEAEESKPYFADWFEDKLQNEIAFAPCGTEITPFAVIKESEKAIYCMMKVQCGTDIRCKTVWAPKSAVYNHENIQRIANYDAALAQFKKAN